MGGRRRAPALVLLLGLLMSGCAAEAGGGLRCELPEGSRLVEAENGGMLLQWANGGHSVISFANGSCVYAQPRVMGQRPVIPESELGYTYDYYRQSLAPCLAALGFPSLAPPSRGAFIESGGDWSPYDAVFSALLGSRDIAAIAVACPDTPPRMP